MRKRRHATAGIAVGGVLVLVALFMIVTLSAIRWVGPWAAIGVLAISMARTGWIIGGAFAHHRGTDAELEAAAISTIPGWSGLVEDVARMSAELGVRGEVHVVPLEDAQPGHPFAGVIRYTPTYGIVLVDEEFLTLPRTYRLAILAHELGHLQLPRPQVMRLVLSRAALPVSVVAAVMLPFNFAASVALATGLWFAVKLIYPAISRREERRADRVAYEYAGEQFAEALTHVTVGAHGTPHTQIDFWWRLEDSWLTHASLSNRLADMRRHPAGSMIEK